MGKSIIVRHAKLPITRVKSTTEIFMHEAKCSVKKEANALSLWGKTDKDFPAQPFGKNVDTASRNERAVLTNLRQISFIL